jgi:hypothetical protein
MNRFLAIAVTLLGFAGAEAQSQEKPKAQWSVFSIHVEKEVPEGVDFFANSLTIGTRIKATVRVPNVHLVGFAANGVKIDQFADDKGTDLLQAQQAGKPKVRFSIVNWTDLKISGEGDLAVISLIAPGWPTAGADKVRVKGTMIALVGKNPKKVEKKNVLLDTAIDLVGGVLKAAKSPTVSYGEWNYRGDKPLKSISFHDADDNRLATIHQSNRHADSKAERGERNAKGGEFSSLIRLKRGILRCTVRSEYFDAVDRIEIPLGIAADLGLR